MRFEWDKKKNSTNKTDHDGISFEEAVAVFSDPHGIEVYDDYHSTIDESRFLLIGLSSKPRVLVVVHADRTSARQDVIRIISARKAGPHEEADYWSQRQ